MATGAKEVKEITKDKAKPEYEEVRTSRDGRKYITVGDVLQSPAGRAEIRRQSENFERVTGSGTTEANGANGTNGSTPSAGNPVTPRKKT